MYSTVTQRPRNIDIQRASALLYGDLGTSKAYVIGLAFALAGYASFWLILAVSLLTILIGMNYTIICKYYPNGGGVYASVRRRSEVISLIGAFFLIADYLVTASLSSLSAFHYLNVSHPVIYSALAIVCIGILNYFGPRHTGSMAFFIGIVAILGLTILIFFSIPHLKTAWHNIKPLTGSSWSIWNHFVGVIVALSGIEAIANITGVMKLNKGSSEKNPNVSQTATPSIAIVIAEVAIYTTFFAFAASAISNFQIAGGEVNAPGYPNVRDSMLRYLAQVFVGQALGETFGLAFAWILSLSIGILLLSAVNTAINGLVALQYLMASDGEFPKKFEKINRFGVPLIPLAIATLIPIFLVLLIKNVSGLATLYAVGFVGAIATNLGATSTDFSLPLTWKERLLMWISCLIMFSVEITLFIEKPNARIYALAVIVTGLLLRALSKKRKKVAPKVSLHVEKKIQPTPTFALLCPIQKKGKALEFALEKSMKEMMPLHLLFIREQSVISEKDYERNWETDMVARQIREYALKKSREDLIYFHYSVSDSANHIIAAYAMRFDTQEIIMDSPHQGFKIVQWLKGSTIKKLKILLPEDVRIIIVTD